MHTTRLRRGLALVTGAMLLASLAATTVAGPVSAADAAKCLGKTATIVGTNGPDVLLGTNGRDVIAGLGGNDIIAGRGGNDLICGGRGKDRIVGNGGRDVILGNAGPDRVVGGAGPDILAGGVGNDVLVGRAGNDSLDGGPGTDTCYQSQGTGPKVRCELPLDKVMAPKPEPPAPTFQSVCKDAGGTYSSDVVPASIGYEHQCFIPHGVITVDEFIDLANNKLGPFCTEPVWGSFGLPDGPGNIYCPLPPT